ncbi:MAG: hypothetical protein ACRD2X_03020 [Vicinamibacteraceae bacterium]
MISERKVDQYAEVAKGVRQTLNREHRDLTVDEMVFALVFALGSALRHQRTAGGEAYVEQVMQALHVLVYADDITAHRGTTAASVQ